MDLLKKVELLINAKSRSALPRRKRQGPLEAEEAKRQAEIRKALGEVREALGNVAAKEQELAQRIKVERTGAKSAAVQGDTDNQHAHERRAAELEHYLRQESTTAINLEEQLARLEEKLLLAQEAVEKEAQKATQRAAAAEEILAENPIEAGPQMEAILNTTPEEMAAAPSLDEEIDEVDVGVRKSRLSD